MNKKVIKVPSGRDIKYISEWSEYKIPKGHCIVDKGVTGCGYTEYMPEFLQYKALSDRLKQGYGKSVEEVADLVYELNSKMAYLKAQDQELSAQYLAIKRFVDNGKLKQITDEYSFFTAIGHSQAVYNAKHFGIFASDMKMIIPAGTDIRVRVMTRPAVIEGKATVVTELAVIDKEGRIVREVTSEGIFQKDFNKEIYEIQSEYGIKSCSVDRKNISGNVRHV